MSTGQFLMMLGVVLLPLGLVSWFMNTGDKADRENAQTNSQDDHIVH